jgi:hypothetical protein
MTVVLLFVDLSRIVEASRNEEVHNCFTVLCSICLKATIIPFYLAYKDDSIFVPVFVHNR